MYPSVISYASHADAPPGFNGHPILHAAVIFSLLLVNLLALEWTWRLVWGMIEDKCEIKHPVTVLRIILLFLVLGAVVRSGPDLLWLTLWDSLAPDGREALLRFDDRMDAFAFIPWSIAWMVSYLGSPMIVHQMQRLPLPIHLWPTAKQMRRPLKIGLGVAVIALTIAFTR